MKTKSKKILKKVGHELKVNPPRILAKTAKKKGKKAAQKQRVAILLSKARKAGAKVVKKPKKFVAGAFENARKKYFGLSKKS
jgi:hypothetical protein